MHKYALLSLKKFLGPVGRQLWSPIMSIYIYNIFCLYYIMICNCYSCTCIYMCNKLGKGRPRLETGTTDDGLLGFLK